ncbi:MAG: thioredoxin domain-containing protein [Ferruginibacter sp.]
MKTLLSLLLVLSTAFSASAQQDTLPVYQRFPTVPPFKIITLPDSSQFSKDDLKKNKATVIMIFSPDCEHCQRATKDLQKHIDLFKNVQIIMASPLDLDIIKRFYVAYNIAAYPNIIMGRDGSYFLGSFFKITNFPSIFVYDKKGNFVQKFEGDVSFSKIAEVL